MNGKSAVSFLVFKKESADMIRTVNAIKAVVERNSSRLPDGVSIEYSNDASRLVRNWLTVVTANGVLGLILIVVDKNTTTPVKATNAAIAGIDITLSGALQDGARYLR